MEHSAPVVCRLFCAGSFLPCAFRSTAVVSVYAILNVLEHFVRHRLSSDHRTQYGPGENYVDDTSRLIFADWSLLRVAPDTYDYAPQPYCPL